MSSPPEIKEFAQSCIKRYERKNVKLDHIYMYAVDRILFTFINSCNTISFM